MGSSDSEEEDTSKSLDEEEIHRIQQIKTHCKGLPDEKKRIQRMLAELDADMLERRTAVKRRLNICGSWVGSTLRLTSSTH